jgi:hypothetical protein
MTQVVITASGWVRVSDPEGLWPIQMFAISEIARMMVCVDEDIDAWPIVTKCYSTSGGFLGNVPVAPEVLVDAIDDRLLGFDSCVRCGRAVENFECDCEEK